MPVNAGIQVRLVFKFGPTAIAFLDSVNLGAQYENDAFVSDINNGNLYRFKPNGARDGFVFNGAGLADLVADNNTELDETIIATGLPASPT